MKIRKSFYKAKIKTQFFVDFSNFHFDQIAKKKKGLSHVVVMIQKFPFQKTIN